MEKELLKEKGLVQFIQENLIVVPFSMIMFVKLLLINKELQLQIYPKGYFLFSAALLISLLIYLPVLFLRKKRFSVLVVSLIFNLIFIGDLVHYRYFGSLPSFESLKLLNEAGKVSGSALLLLKFRDILYFLDLFIFALIMLIKPMQKDSNLLSKNKRFLYAGLCSIILFSFFVGLIYHDRNNLKNLKVSMFDKKMIVDKYTVIGSHIFSIYKAFAETSEKISENEKKETVEWLQKNAVKEVVPNQYTGIAKGKNVIVIQMESLQNFVVGKKVNGFEVTPNLNKFLSESHYFANNFYEIGMGNTSDSDFQVNTSLHPLTDAATFVRYPRQDYYTLPKVLNDEGYSTSAYHAYNRNFWNREVAFPKLGYENYFAQESFPNGENLIMGLNDRDFFAKTAEYIKESKKPSFSYVISLSSHYPFDMPEKFQNDNFEKENIPYRLYHYLQSIHFADQAFGEFVEKLKAEGLYEDTLIITYGDHLAKVADDPADDIYSPLGLSKDSYKDELELKKTPLMIKMPGQKESQKHHNLTSTIDIMPTILNLTGYEKSFLSFGNDVFGGKNFFISDHYFTYFSDDNFHYYQEEGELPSCHQGKKYQEKPLEECRFLIERAEKEKKYSSNLIKYNLFKDLKW